MYVSKAPEAVPTPVCAPRRLVQSKLCAFYIDLIHFNRPNRIHLVIDQRYLKINWRPFLFLNGISSNAF